MSDDAFTREDYERMLMEVRIELLDSEGERKRLLRRTKQLEAERAREHRDTPEFVLLEELFQRWKRGLGKNKNTKLGPARVKAGLAATKRHDREELSAAIDGIVKFPYVVRGKRAMDGKPEERYDEFELCLRDEIKVEQFARLGREQSPVLVPKKDDPFWRPLERALYALTREFGRDVTEFQPGPPYTRDVLKLWSENRVGLPELPPDEWWCICPLHPHSLERPMRIRERDGIEGARLEFACAHEDCTEDALRTEMRRLEWRRIYGSVDAPPEGVAA